MVTKLIVVVLVALTLSGCGGGIQPMESTQTAVAVQQQQLELTQVALSLGPTQTALAHQQSVAATQIAATQTREAEQIAATQTREARGGVMRNADWTPVEQDFDGVTMVQVPAGCFMMGSDDNYEDETPQHEICFDAPFWIDQTEVSQGQFVRFGGVQSAASYFSGENRPVENITWFEARDFCELRGGRLPTEAEWEYAVRGPSNFVYPWGDEWDELRAVWNRTSDQGTAEVGSLPEGASWVGALDMTGNVWEWVSSWYDSYPYNAADGREADTGTSTDVLRVLRGGVWDYFILEGLRAADRGGSFPESTRNYIGFRCARTQVNPALAATQQAILGSAVIQEFDGVPMVLVPPGCFLMGTEDEEVARLNIQYSPFVFSGETPQHEVCFDASFWIDQTEVTQAQFALFGGEAASESQFSGDHRPVENITWFEARDFCELRGVRLPTEAEWEYAARGPSGFVYPWGNEWDESRAVLNQGDLGTANVGSIPEGASWVGALDMSGNVGEWVSSLYEPYPYNAADGREGDTGTRIDVRRVLRGGGTNGDVTNTLRAASRYWFNPNGSGWYFGFRCARSS